MKGGPLRKQLRTPVGNKTKRGAELEGTPKTPRIDSISPVRSASVERGLVLQEDHLKLPPSRTRRLLHWSVTKQPPPSLANAVASAAAFCAVDHRSSVADPDLSQIENNSSAPPCPPQTKSSDSFKPAALSPLCLNAIQASADLQTDRRFSVKKPTDVYVKQQNLDPAMRERACDDAGLRNERMFLWSNPAFNQVPAAVPSKGNASGSGCSSSSSSTSFRVQETDFGTEADDCHSDAESCPMSDGEKEAVEDAAGGASGDRHPIKASVDGYVADDADEDDARIAADSDVTEAMAISPATSKDSTLHVRPVKSEMGGDTAREMKRQQMLEDGRIACKKMQEIDEEIERLTSRITELMLQKRKWEEEMKQMANSKLEEDTEIQKLQPRTMAKPEDKKCAEAGDGPKRANVSTAVGRASEEKRSTKTTTARGRGEQAWGGAAGKDKNGGGESPAAMAQRRISLPGAGDGGRAAARTKLQQQKAAGGGANTATPSRVVSSRYGGGGRSKMQTPVSEPSKKRERSCGGVAMAMASPQQAQQQQSASKGGGGGSPMKRVATMRRGYPTRTAGIAPPPVPATSPAMARNSRIAGDSSPKSTAALYQCLESLVEDSKNFFKRISPARRPPTAPPSATGVVGSPSPSPSPSMDNSLVVLERAMPLASIRTSCRVAVSVTSSSLIPAEGSGSGKTAAMGGRTATATATATV